MFVKIRHEINIPHSCTSDSIWKYDRVSNYVLLQFPGMSPLYRAILSKAAKVCQVLIHAGADVNMRRLGVHGESAKAETPLIK